jgi:hypothetical protein
MLTRRRLYGEKVPGKRTDTSVGVMCTRQARPVPYSLDAAVACSCASVSPFWQFTAFNPSTYSLPRLPT